MANFRRFLSKAGRGEIQLRKLFRQIGAQTLEQGTLPTLLCWVVR